MAGTSGTIGFEHVGIGTAVHHNRLAVPPNQRDYSWEDKHVLALFQDLAKAIDANKSAYFLGTIVLTTGKVGALAVADVQQRLATSTILCAVIPYYLHNHTYDIIFFAGKTDLLFTTSRQERKFT